MGNTSIGGEGGNFPQTVWKVILSAKNRQSACYKDNLNYLISRYWKPVYIHIRLKWGKSNEDAKDLTQEFFTQFLIKNMLESARPGLGLFRTYVKKLLRNFLIDNSRAESRQKRGGGQRKISLSSVREDEVKFTGEPDNFDVFDKEWAKCVIDNSLKRLESYLHQGNKPAYYKIFYLYDIDRSDQVEKTYGAFAKRFSMNESDVRNRLSYTRRLFKKLLKEEIMNYSATSDIADAELRELLSL